MITPIVEAVCGGQDIKEDSPMNAPRVIIRWTATVLAMGLLISPWPLAASQATVDHGLYRELLQRHVHNGLVDYDSLKQDASLLDRYLEILAAIDPGTLSDPQRFAFYVNAYNAWTLKLVLTHYPGIDSIKDIGSFWQSPWKMEIARIDGRRLTLDQIEHDILRAEYKEPRVHFAINCASMGCPPLMDTPFTGLNLDAQLDHATRAFINDPRRYRLENGVLYVSRIFKWFSEDFDNDPVAFFRRYAEGDLKARLEAHSSDLRVAYLEYDWSLNKL
jgi:hypothetical protein